MAAKNTQKVRMCIVPSTLNISADLIPTVIEAVVGDGTKPESIKVTVANTVKVGEIIKFGNVGFPNINNKAFVVTVATANDFTIGNAKLGAGTLAGSPVIHHYDEADMGCLCLSSFTINAGTTATIDTSTYCGSSSIPSAKVESGSATASGYVDVTDTGYKDILIAIEDGGEYLLRITLGDNGYLIVPVTLSSLSYEFPLDGAQSYTFQFTFGAQPKHVF
jgi:hypothetical protein